MLKTTTTIRIPRKIIKRCLSSSGVDPRVTTNPISQLPRKAVWKNSQRVLRSKLRDFNDDLDFFLQRPAKVQTFIEDNYTVSYEALQYWMNQKSNYVDGDGSQNKNLNHSNRINKEKTRNRNQYDIRNWLDILNSPTPLMNTDNFILKSSTFGLLKNIDLTFNEVYIKELISYYETITGKEVNSNEISVELLDEIRSFIVSNEMSNYENTMKSRVKFKIDDESCEILIEQLNSGEKSSNLDDFDKNKLCYTLLNIMSYGFHLTPFETHYLVMNQSQEGENLDAAFKVMDENKNNLDVTSGVYNTLLKNTIKTKANIKVKTDRILQHMSSNKVLPDYNTVTLLLESIDPKQLARTHNVLRLARALRCDFDAPFAEKTAQAFLRAGAPQTALNILCACVLSCFSHSSLDPRTATALDAKTSGMSLLEKTKCYLDAVPTIDVDINTNQRATGDVLIYNHLVLKQAGIPFRATLLSHCVLPSPQLVALALSAAVALPRGAREALAVVYSILERFRMTC